MATLASIDRALRATCQAHTDAVLSGDVGEEATRLHQRDRLLEERYELSKTVELLNR